MNLEELVGKYRAQGYSELLAEARVKTVNFTELVCFLRLNSVKSGKFTELASRNNPLPGIFRDDSRVNPNG